MRAHNGLYAKGRLRRWVFGHRRSVCVESLVISPPRVRVSGAKTEAFGSATGR